MAGWNNGRAYVGGWNPGNAYVGDFGWEAVGALPAVMQQPMVQNVAGRLQLMPDSGLVQQLPAFMAQQSAPQQMAPQQMAPQPLGPGGLPLPKWIQPGLGKKLPIPISTESVAAGATRTITLQPQRAMNIKRLVLVTSDKGFVVDSFVVGTVPQFNAAGDLPAEVFSPGSFDVELDGSIATPGITITLVVRNTNSVPITIGGAILGDTLE